MKNTVYLSALITACDLDEPAIWVGCLAAYNGGTLHGAWIQAAPLDEMQEAVQEILAASPVPGAEEWEIMDRNAIPREFGGSLEAVALYADTLAALADLGVNEPAEVLAAYVSWKGRPDLKSDGDTIADEVREAYAGKWDTLQDWAEAYADDCGLLEDIPAEIARYFDFESYARDFETNGDIYHGDDGHTFWANR